MAMSSLELKTHCEAIYGKRWMIKAAHDSGWSYFTISRAANGRIPISEKLEKDIRALKPKKGAKP